MTYLAGYVKKSPPSINQWLLPGFPIYLNINRKCCNKLLPTEISYFRNQNPKKRNDFCRKSNVYKCDVSSCHLLTTDSCIRKKGNENLNQYRKWGNGIFQKRFEVGFGGPTSRHSTHRRWNGTTYFLILNRCFNTRITSQRYIYSFKW